MAEPTNDVVAQDTNSVNSATAGETVPAGEGTEAAPPPRQGLWGVLKSLAIRMVIIYAITSFLRRPSTPPADPAAPGAPTGISPALNIFSKEQLLDMYIYINEEETFSEFDKKETLFWVEEDMMYGDWTGGPNKDGSMEKSGKLQISENVKNNGSIYLHVYFVKTGNSPNPIHKARYQKKYTVYRSKRLNKYKKRRYHSSVNLLTGQTNVHPDMIKRDNTSLMEILSHWHPNLTINLIDDHTPWTKNALPAPLDEFIEFLPDSSQYKPILYINDYWNMNTDYMPINDTTPELNFTLTYAPMSLFKWQMYAAQSMRSKWYSFLGEDMMKESDEDQDSLKQTFLETSPYLLALTIVVSIVHSVFEFLAFKNDIQFWRNRKSLEGLSVRSVFYGVFQSFIVLLYVLDNETNFVVRVSVFIGLGIEIWKIHKVMDIKMDPQNRLFGILPRISFSDKNTYTQSDTKKFDQLAFRYLSWGLFPLLIAYMVYSLLYMEHKGWYSWVLNMLYGFLLTFGFIMMTPQLFINYKLKSVAHLPWRMLTYKALNTFIDDLFAFVIKMPTLYRLGCFRDDIIFLIYLYQRYIYKVDLSRVNEFGTTGEMANGDATIGPEGEQLAIEEQSKEETERTSTPPPPLEDVEDKAVEEKKND